MFLENVSAVSCFFLTIDVIVARSLATGPQARCLMQVFEPVSEMVRSRAVRGLSDRESQAAGTVMAVVDAQKAKPMLIEWVRPPGMFKRWVEMPGAQSMQRTALYGLTDLPGKEVDAVIRWLSERCAEDVYKVCMRTLVHRRKVGVNDGE